VEEDKERLASFLKSASVLKRVVSRLNPALPNMTQHNHRVREKKDPFTRVLSFYMESTTHPNDHFFWMRVIERYTPDSIIN
jgi:hypothetical protein